ncbi:MAG: thiamine pyrophosphate-dependent dehydrogenase E1 component subunit alpha, partial [Actinobacteria bacterium]|nr:thiamine pyrophosphate-dependent dehydrogenase E1 component subunit alpha [Actinomycetota bacterium]
AVATGVCANLKKEDFICSTHRGHGHLIAKGADMKYMMAELYGKKTGYCKGRGGSMHISDASIGILGANGIVGGGIPIATGAGYGCQYLKNNCVVVSFFGDGAADTGAFHESLNLASIWKLPVIYIVENNYYALSFKCEGDGLRHVNVKNIADRAKAYNITGMVADGMDVIDVYQKINSVIADVRSGMGPVLIEAKTYRYKGHHLGDHERYRTKQEVEFWKKKDPIPKLENILVAENVLTRPEIEKMRKNIEDEIDAAVQFARKSPGPAVEEVTDFIFA